MMDAKQLGQEPAHPKIIQAVTAVASYPDYDFNGYGGLTKREAFAMAAMQAIIPIGASCGGTIADASKILGIQPIEFDQNKHPQMLIARDAVSHADALLAELAKEQI